MRQRTRLSCHRCWSNEVRLWLSVISYKLGNVWRHLVLPKRIEKWSDGRLIKHARYYGLLLAESHVTRRLLEASCRGSSRYPCRPNGGHPESDVAHSSDSFTES